MKPVQILYYKNIFCSILWILGTYLEGLTMAITQPRLRGRLSRGQRQTGEEPPPKKPVGRPKGAPSTIINVRLPLALVAQLDRYLDRLEGQTGLKANRGMIARRALALFLAAHASDDTPGGKV
jgi:hypothetical protein